MSEPEYFVLDTNVLSSFFAVGWLKGVGCWDPQKSLMSPERVWQEFSDYWEARKPDWLEIEQVDLSSEKAQNPGALAMADWACIVLAESKNGACVVTNDQRMHQAADERDVPYQWGTAFFLSTFFRCGVSETSKDEGIEAYADDLGLGSSIVDELEAATK